MMSIEKFLMINSKLGSIIKLHLAIAMLLTPKQLNLKEIIAKERGVEILRILNGWLEKI